MAKISVLGGTGYAGSSIVREAIHRGHAVTSISRNLPDIQIPGVSYIAANVQEDATLDAALENADIVVFALAARGELTGVLETIADKLIAKAKARGVRLSFVGGAGSLFVVEGGPRGIETPEFNAEYLPEATTMTNILETLHKTSDLDWFYVSPSAAFGAWAPGEATGKFRLGADVLLVGEDGQSFISGADYATAFVDEIESPAHTGKRFTVGY